MTDCIAQYFRCPKRFINLSLGDPPLGTRRYRPEEDGPGNHRDGLSISRLATEEDAFSQTIIRDGKASLPFDLAEIVDSLRYEQYAEASTQKSAVRSVINWAYYSVRPFMPVAVRKHLQSLYLSRWKQRAFPQWPVDRTVDDLIKRTLLQSMKAAGVDRVPFIWFWPEGAASCAIVTHDVETRAGRDFSKTLMDIDDSFGIKASFQVVPEERYEVSEDYLNSITGRGFEVAVQDLNHDGRLYQDRRQFMARAAKINSYGRKWGAEGFRAAVLYRRQEWFDGLEFSYDMSVPNVAHLDPQRGGCCTVMPYFVGKILELPVTTIQDYTLFHILNDYSIDLWKRQIELIMETNGLISVIVHPDYITEVREQSIYEALLAHLAQLREKEGIWIARPDEVNSWWRQRAGMQLIEDTDWLRIEGPGGERARIAYATESEGQLVFTVQNGSAVRRVQSSVSR
jgi:hypothetical protein